MVHHRINFSFQRYFLLIRLHPLRRKIWRKKKRKEKKKKEKGKKLYFQYFFIITNNKKKKYHTFRIHLRRVYIRSLS